MSSDPAVGAPGTSSEHDQLKSLGKYEIQKKLGAGGMGTVFLAIDQDLRRTVALKVLPRDRAENAILVRRFKAEAQAAAQLHHKNIVGVYEAGQADGLLYIALEFIDGVDALDLIRRRGVVPVKRSVEIVRGVADALQHAYEKNIVHRDIKPSNLMIAKDGEVKLADMGLARSIDDTLDTSITRAGTTVGTVDYMAPEQARDSKAADIRSDLYSLGCTWYHLITGEPPFGDGDVMAKVQAHALKSPPDPRRLNDRIPEAIVAVIQRLMAKKPQDRYQTPQDLIADLANPNLHRQGVTSDLLASLAKAHEEEAEADEDEEGFDAPQHESPGRRSASPPPRRKGVSTSSEKSDPGSREAGARETGSRETGSRDPGSKSQTSKASASRSAGTKPTGSSAGAKSFKGSSGKKGAEEQVESVIGQALDEEAHEDDEQAGKKANRRKSSGEQRTLPDRMDAPKVEASISQMSIDPAFFQIGLIVLVVGAVIGAIAWFLKSGSGSPIDDKGSLAGIVQRNDALNSQPTAPRPSETQAEPMPQPDAAPAVVSVVPTIQFSGPQDTSPLAGLEEGADQAKASLPAWLPYTRGPAPNEIPVVKVRRFRTEPGELASVAQLGQRDKVVLEFLDEGPHTIPATALSNVKWLGLRGREIRPALIVSGVPAPGTGVLGTSRGSLKVEGVDLFWNVSTTDEIGSLLASTAGDVLFRNSTVTITGAGRPAILQLKGQAGTLTRAVFENAVLRSDNGEGIRIEGPGVELVTGNLLSLTGGTFLTIEAADQAAANQLATTRVGRFLGSTVVTRQSLFTARHRSGPPPAGVDLRFEHFAGVRHGKDSAAAPAIQLFEWPDNPPENGEAARPVGFKLQGEGLRFAGWSDLTQPSSGPAVTDSIGWRLFWRHQVPSEDFQPAPPAAVAAWDGSYSAFAPDVLASDLRIGGESGISAIGCRFGQLPRPQEGLSQHVAAFSTRPPLAESVAKPAAGGEVRFDLKKASTFNRFLNSECPDNARVIAFGSGIKFLDPIVIKKKSLTIVFEQSEGSPLELQPLSKSGNEKNAPEALFTVSEGGRLEFVNGRFEVLYSKGKLHPKRFASAEGSTLVLTNCEIEGSQSLDAPAIGLVQVISTPAGGSLLCRGTYLHGKGPLVDLSGPKLHARIENSILVSGMDALSLSGSMDQGVVDLDSTTISASGPAIRIVGDNAGPVRFFVSQSLFVPALAGSGSLVVDDSRGAGSRITWWGLANAYSSKLADFVIGEGHPAGKQEFERDWTNVWGQGHDLRPASGEQAVILESPLGKPADLKATDFVVKSGCLAAIWDDKGGPVGADASKVGPPKGAKPGAPAGKPMPMPMAPKKPADGF